ncbi:hypothetical protein EF847_11195 [Actinobacteria bacterium YIM 96077]|uniref:SAF domain-containing protein n=1 Tax=Phytoactinopolyspora halophila TaxID=1981511 RepID=A0A329QZ34_9ACTN|nr:UxaA family hydrolase [Phytoactinopolyspora halophila]AYY13176.1 hypothetical protein EF847_11195 [Actinobacteria bacterium YIM 96077]RAW17585.1 hypothetical protein DPM12_06225 [Phytoactinopolyspora halophila]
MPEEHTKAVPQFLAHKEGDHVAVAVQDVSPGTAHGCILHGDQDLTVDVQDTVPLGHKIALTDLAEGVDVIEYGVRVGITTAPITAGQYVHTHNVRSARWQSSVAH